MEEKLVIKMSAKNCRTMTDFLVQIWPELQMPENETPSWDGFLDWIQDLSWIDAKEIQIVIDDSEYFLANDSEAKQLFFEDLDYIYAFWKDCAVAGHIFGDENGVKSVSFRFA